jgi:hypothetical protein
MKRYSFHPRRLAASIAFLVGLFGGIILLSLTVSVDIAKVCAPFLGFVLMGAVFILPAWIMQPRETPPPRGRGREPNQAQVVRLIRRQQDPPPLDRAARIASVPV